MCKITGTFGVFEWILAWTLVGFTVYLIHYCRKTARKGQIKRCLYFLGGGGLISFVLFYNGGDRRNDHPAATCDGIKPYITVASCSSKSSEKEELFAPVSVSKENLFQQVSTPKTVQNVGADVTGIPQQDTDGLNPYSGSQQSVSQSVPETTHRGVVSAELTTKVSSSADPIRPVSFQPQSEVTPRAKLNNSEMGTLAETSARSSTETVAQGLETAKLASVQIDAKIRKRGNKGGLREAEETGSGFIIMTRTGDFYVITNNHVAGNPVSNEEVKITLSDKREIHPKRVISSEEFDLAVLELDKHDILPAPLQHIDSGALHNLFNSGDSSLTWNPATLGNSDSVRIAESVWVIGCPFGLEGTITKGIVSGLDRHSIPLGTENQIQGFIQTDASVNPGNSGGPLINSRGEVIGVMIAIASKTGESSGVSFAIPINNAIHVAEQLIRDGVYQHPYIGVKLDRNFSATEKIQSGLLLDSTSIVGKVKRACGTRIKSVVPGSPADLAGLRQGDVILRYNSKTIEDEKRFEYMISLSKIDDAPTIEILRDGRRYTVTPKLTDRGVMHAQNVSLEKEY